MLFSIYFHVCACLCIYLSYIFDWKVLLDQIVPAPSEHENTHFQEPENKAHHDSISFCL